MFDKPRFETDKKCSPCVTTFILKLSKNNLDVWQASFWNWQKMFSMCDNLYIWKLIVVLRSWPTRAHAGLHGQTFCQGSIFQFSRGAMINWIQDSFVLKSLSTILIYTSMFLVAIHIDRRAEKNIVRCATLAMPAEDHCLLTLTSSWWSSICKWDKDNNLFLQIAHL